MLHDGTHFILLIEPMFVQVCLVSLLVYHTGRLMRLVDSWLEFSKRGRSMHEFFPFSDAGDASGDAIMYPDSA